SLEWVFGPGRVPLPSVPRARSHLRASLRKQGARGHLFQAIGPFPLETSRRVNIEKLKVALLRALEDASPRQLNKTNLIGRPYQRGDIESRLAIEFDARERSLAAKAFDELRSAGFIVPTLSDFAAPEDWVVITDAGRD